MAKYRGRNIAGVSIANPRRIMKKVARARVYVSLHCSDGLKDESMKTLRSLADSTISIEFPLANVRGSSGGCPMERWQHFPELREKSHFTDQSHSVRRPLVNYSIFYWHSRVDKVSAWFINVNRQYNCCRPSFRCIVAPCFTRWKFIFQAIIPCLIRC